MLILQGPQTDHTQNCSGSAESGKLCYKELNIYRLLSQTLRRKLKFVPSATHPTHPHKFRRKCKCRKRTEARASHPCDAKKTEKRGNLSWWCGRKYDELKRYIYFLFLSNKSVEGTVNAQNEWAHCRLSAVCDQMCHLLSTWLRTEERELCFWLYWKSAWSEDFGADSGRDNLTM